METHAAVHEQVHAMRGTEPRPTPAATDSYRQGKEKQTRNHTQTHTETRGAAPNTRSNRQLQTGKRETNKKSHGNAYRNARNRGNNQQRPGRVTPREQGTQLREPNNPTNETEEHYHLQYVQME